MSRPENGSSAGMKKGAGSSPGIEVFARKPGTTLMDIPASEKMRSRGSMEMACNSPRLFAEASASRQMVFHGHLIHVVGDSQLGGSNSGDLRARSTLGRSHSGTLGRGEGLDVEKDFINFVRHGCSDTGIPSREPKVDAIEDL